jgi:hypothetical protein
MTPPAGRASPYRMCLGWGLPDGPTYQAEVDGFIDWGEVVHVWLWGIPTAWVLEDGKRRRIMLNAGRAFPAFQHLACDWIGLESIDFVTVCSFCKHPVSEVEARAMVNGSRPAEGA